MARHMRRSAVAAAIAAAVMGGAGLAVADGGLRISPTSGPEGSSYDIDVDCGAAPALANQHTQDGPEQGTIAAFVPDDIVEVAPSTWRVTRTAGTTDEIWWAECEGTDVGQDRFDAEAPHLWFGPRPSAGFTPIAGRTTLEGTDCPPGTTAGASVIVGGSSAYVYEAEIDEHGDWSIELPVAVGEAEMEIDASCGDVTYETLQATTTSTSSTSTSTTTTTTTTTTPNGASPAPAAPVRGAADYTG